jgi:surface antigen
MAAARRNCYGNDMVPQKTACLAAAGRVALVIGLAATLSGCLVAGGAVIVAERHKAAEAAVSKVAVPIRPQFDERDQDPHDAAFAQAVSGAAPVKTARWNNPATGNSGTIEATAIAADKSQSCRQIVETYVKPDKTYNGSTRFCRSGNADWQAAES